MKPFDQVFDPTYLKGGESETNAKKHGWGDRWKEKHVFKFTWKYCSLCEVMYVVCPACGNNCCNSGFGKVDENMKPVGWAGETAEAYENAKDCPVCNLAYQYQHLAIKTKTAPEPTESDIEEATSRQQDAIDELFNDDNFKSEQK